MVNENIQVSEEVKKIIEGKCEADWNRVCKKTKYYKEVFIALRSAHHLSLCSSFYELKLIYPSLLSALQNQPLCITKKKK